MSTQSDEHARTAHSSLLRFLAFPPSRQRPRYKATTWAPALRARLASGTARLRKSPRLGRKVAKNGTFRTQKLDSVKQSFRTSLLLLGTFGLIGRAPHRGRITARSRQSRWPHDRCSSRSPPPSCWLTCRYAAALHPPRGRSLRSVARWTRAVAWGKARCLLPSTPRARCICAASGLSLRFCILFRCSAAHKDNETGCCFFAMRRSLQCV